MFIIMVVISVYKKTLPKKNINPGFGRTQEIICYRGSQTQVYEERWYLNQELHRGDNLPAYVAYYRSGQVKEEEWYVNGRLIRKRHR